MFESEHCLLATKYYVNFKEWLQTEGIRRKSFFGQIKHRDPKGNALSAPQTEGICNRTQGLAMQMLKKAGHPAYNVSFLAKSPGSMDGKTFGLIQHWAAATELNGKYYLFDEPQSRFLCSDPKLNTGEWQNISDPKTYGKLFKYFMGDVGGSAQTAFFGGRVDPVFTDPYVTKPLIKQPTANNGWWQGKIDGVPVRWRNIRGEDDWHGWGGEWQFQMPKGYYPLKYTKKYFDPYFIPINPTELSREYSLPPEAAMSQAIQIIQYILYSKGEQSAIYGGRNLPEKEKEKLERMFT